MAEKMKGKQVEDRDSRRGCMTIVIIALVLLVAGLAALMFLGGIGAGVGVLSGAIGGGDQGNPLPTPLPAIDVGSGASSAAKETPQATWESYLSDIIAEQVSRQEAKITLFERYQDPDVAAQNVGGLVTDIDLVQDNTEFNFGSQSTYVNIMGDFDVRLTFANGDTDTRTCSLPVAMEFDQDDEVWYVVNPDALAVFVVCG